MNTQERLDTQDYLGSQNNQSQGHMPSPSISRPQGNTSYRWVIIALSFIIIVINYMDRTAISYAVGPIQKEFGLNNTDYGLIAAAFGVGYTIMTLGGGIIVDLWGARKVWTGSAIAWSICTGLLGASNGLQVLALLRVTLGITEGPCFPSMTRAVTDWLPMAERARSTAISLAAVPLASAIGAPFISHLIAQYGWRMMFVILSSLGIVWAFAWWKAFRDYPQNSPHVSQSELNLIHEGKEIEHHATDDELRKHHLAAGKTTWKFILFNPSLMANNFAFFSFGYLLFFATTWLPAFLEQTYHLKVKEVGLYCVAPWLTAAVFLTAGGFICDWLWKKTGSVRKSRSHIIWICQLLSALCFIPVTMGPSLTIALVFISLGLAFGLMPNPAFYAINSDLAKDRAATSLGLMDCFLAAAGVLAPFLTGWMSTVTGNFNSAIYLMCGLTILSSFGVILFQHPDRNTITA